MPHQLPVDCLNEILECSSLLVNRFWCKVSVSNLWTSIQNYNTLIACLPKESKEILSENEIVIPIPTSKPPLFDYVSFIKSLSISEIYYCFTKVDGNKHAVLAQEIFKMFMS